MRIFSTFLVFQGGGQVPPLAPPADAHDHRYLFLDYQVITDQHLLIVLPSDVKKVFLHLLFLTSVFCFFYSLLPEKFIHVYF